MRDIVKFLGEDWTDDMLDHQKFIGSEIAISKLEWSTSQIKKPVYQDSLSNWMDKIPYLSEAEILQLAPMMKFFGYDLKVNKTIIQKQKKVAKKTGYPTQ